MHVRDVMLFDSDEDNEAPAPTEARLTLEAILRFWRELALCTCAADGKRSGKTVATQMPTS